MKFTSAPSLAIWLCGVLTCAAGCGGLDLGMMTDGFTRESPASYKESPENFVEQVIPCWQESEGPGLKPGTVSRGFGGQIYFITNSRGLPSEVKGSVRIYVFDDQGSEEEQAKPIHQFDFPAESWKAYMTKSKLGPSYSVFVPYTRQGGKTANCAIRVRYTPENGTPVFSQMVAIAMSGSKPNLELKDESEGISVPELSRRNSTSAGKVTQASATGGRGQSQIQTLGLDAAARKPKSAGRKSRNSRPAAKSMNAKDAFMGTSAGDLPADEETVDELLSDDLDLDPTANHKQAAPAADEEDDDSAPAMRTYTIPLGK